MLVLAIVLSILQFQLIIVVVVVVVVVISKPNDDDEGRTSLLWLRGFCSEWCIYMQACHRALGNLIKYYPIFSIFIKQSEINGNYNYKNFKRNSYTIDWYWDVLKKVRSYPRHIITYIRIHNMYVHIIICNVYSQGIFSKNLDFLSGSPSEKFTTFSS